MHVAIECKNYKGRVGIKEIDAFVAKLEDVGIPAQNGIFVCVNSYESGALRRAKKAGVQTLLIDGLTPDRMQAQVHEAFQSIVYLLLDVTKFEITSGVEDDEAGKLLWFRDDQNRLLGGILDIVWLRWRDGELPTELGEHEVPIVLPPTWRWAVGNDAVPNTAAVTVRVLGLVVTETGTVERLMLKDSETGVLERIKIHGNFDTVSSGPRSLPVEVANSEIDLNRLLDKPAVARVSVGRLALPRIRYGPLYWPPSQRTADFLDGQFKARLSAALQRWWQFGTPPDEHVLFPVKGWEMGIDVIEGTDLGAVWDPIMPSHPAVYDGRWPFSQPRRRVFNPTKRRGGSRPSSMGRSLLQRAQPPAFTGSDGTA